MASESSKKDPWPEQIFSTLDYWKCLLSHAGAEKLPGFNFQSCAKGSIRFSFLQGSATKISKYDAYAWPCTIHIFTHPRMLSVLCKTTSFRVSVVILLHH